VAAQEEWSQEPPCFGGGNGTALDAITARDSRGLFRHCG
jgi:hypothetical protein